ncbi:MAG: DUF6159 family protein [bacterium]|nr:DUF6159 family protein [bacterium]
MEQTEKLKAYIYSQLQSGVNPNEITAQLRGAGWDEQRITEAFSGVQAQIVPAATPVQDNSTQVVAESLQPATFQASGKKRGRIKTSWLLMKQSLKVLRNNKQLLKYPLMGGIINILVTIIFAIIFYIGRDSLIFTAKDVFGDNEVYLKGPGYILGFIYYVLAFFIIFIYNAGLAAHVLDIFRGTSRDYKHYMKIAWSKKRVIFVFSLINSTVGIILHFIEQRAGWLGWIVSRIFGILWTLANLFTIPIIVETESSAPSAIKQSSKLFKSRWGENIAARITFGGLMFLFYLLIFIPVITVLGILLSMLGTVGLILIIPIIIFSLILFATVETAASNILSTALYYYARYGEVPAAFDAELLNSTLIPKRQKRRLFGKKPKAA